MDKLVYQYVYSISLLQTVAPSILLMHNDSLIGAILEYEMHSMAIDRFTDEFSENDS